MTARPGRRARRGRQRPAAAGTGTCGSSERPRPRASSDALSARHRGSCSTFLNRDLFTVSELVPPSTRTDTTAERTAAGAPRLAVYPPSGRKSNGLRSRNQPSRAQPVPAEERALPRRNRSAEVTGVGSPCPSPPGRLGVVLSARAVGAGEPGGCGQTSSKTTVFNTHLSYHTETQLTGFVSFLLVLCNCLFFCCYQSNIAFKSLSHERGKSLH